eukprot:sb/3467925/
MILQQCAETGNWNRLENEVENFTPVVATPKETFYSEVVPKLKAPPSTREGYTVVRGSSPKVYKPRPPTPKKHDSSQVTTGHSQVTTRPSVSAKTPQSPVPNKTQPVANNLNVGQSAAKSVLRLQSLIRGFSSRLRYKNLVEQRQMQLYREYKRLLVASVLVQRIWRGYTVRRDLWNWLPWLHRRQERRREMERGVVAVQSLARGWIVRKRIAERSRTNISGVDSLSCREYNYNTLPHTHIHKTCTFVPTPFYFSRTTLRYRFGTARQQSTGCLSRIQPV